jgi:hypothetical protein
MLLKDVEDVKVSDVPSVVLIGGLRLIDVHVVERCGRCQGQ